MEMKSMKISAEEKKKYAEPTIASEQQQYPYGLSISLDQDVLDKLGMSKLPDVGDKMMLHAKVEICSVSQSESQGGGKNSHVQMQITDMAIGGASDDKKEDASQALYGIPRLQDERSNG